MDKKLRQVLDELSPEEYHTSAELAENLGVSDKTVRVRIKELRDILAKHGARLVSKQRLGFIIQIFDQEQYDEFCSDSGRGRQEGVPVTPAERVDFILTYLLCHENYIRIEDLGDMMYVSKNTLAGDMKRVETYLREYDVRILRRPNYGIRAQGSEFNLRLCIANYLVKRGILLQRDFGKMQAEQAVIGECVLAVFKEREILVEELSLQNLIYHIYTAMKRVQHGYVMPRGCSRGSCDEMEPAVQIAEEILGLVSEKTTVQFPESESEYLAIHLAGKRAIAGDKGNFENLIISQQMMDLAEEMLDTVYQTFRFDLRNDLELRLAMVEHLVPLDIRLKYHMELKNPILEEIKENYAFPFMVANQAVLPIVKRYKRELSEDETGYFAVLFALAMEKGKVISRKNILLVCASGKSSAELMAYRYRKEFGEYLNEIRLCGIQELPDISFDGIDYVFTTVPIKHPVPVPILEVKVFLEDAEAVSLRKALALENSDFLADYYRKELFFTDLPCADKAEIIAYLCERAGEVVDLPEGFCESVMRREEMAGTDFGNLVALPHPIDLAAEVAFVCVGILKHPVLWKTREVQCVFLISVSDREDSDIQRFYQQTTNLAMNKEKIQRLTAGKDFNLLMELLGESD